MALQGAPQFSLLASAPADSHPSTGDSFFRELNLCPDQSCVLALSESRALSLHSLSSSSSDPANPPPFIEKYWTYSPPDSIFSTAWYPGATISNPPMFAFALAIKDHPVQLMDAGIGTRLRASYPIIDHTERFVAPHCLMFSNDGSLLYGGFENAIEVMDVSRPGCSGTRLHTSPNRSSKDGQKGIISSLASRPDETGSLIAAGSFSGSVGLYDPSVGTGGVLVGLLPAADENFGGVTKVAFHPNGNILYSASRQSTFIEIWDLRNYSERAATIPRTARTNLRMGFDVSRDGRDVLVGDSNGEVSIWDAQAVENEKETVKVRVSKDPVGSSIFLGDGSSILTCSGSRKHLPRRREASGSDSSDSEKEEESRAEGDKDEETNSLRLWKRIDYEV